MASKRAKAPPATELAKVLLAAWERTRTDNAPPAPATPRELADLADVVEPDARIVQAVKAEPLKARAQLPPKTKASIETPLTWKPTPQERKEFEEEALGRLPSLLLEVVDDHSRRGLLPTRGDLEANVHVHALTGGDKKLFDKGFKQPAFTGHVLATRATKTGPAADALFLHPGAIGDDALIAALIRQLLEDKAEKPDSALDAKKLTKPLTKPLGVRVEELLKRFQSDQRHIPGVHYVRLSRTKTLFFAVQAIRPRPPAASEQPPPPATSARFNQPPNDLRQPEASAKCSPEGDSDEAPLPKTHSEPSPPDPVTPIATSLAEAPFEPAFRAAFDRILARNGGSRLVKLSDLRRALPQFDRQRFDSGLRSLRLDRAFHLDRHDGTYKTLTPDDRAAAIEEGGSVFVYAKRGLQ